MRRILLGLVVVSLSLPLSGCYWAIAVSTTGLTGVVRYPGGHPVPSAKVWTDDGTTAWADSQGCYRIVVPVSGRRITIRARDGYEPGKAYAVTHHGSVSVPASGAAEPVDIVLDSATPI